MSGETMELLGELDHHWRHCLRCSLADIRNQVDEKTSPAPVPLVSSLHDWGPPRPNPRLHILLPTPDSEQWQGGNLGGVRDPKEPSDSAHRAVLETAFEGLLHLMPFRADRVTVGTALGCRPVNFKNPRLLSKPRADWLKSCRPRWQAELLIVDPVMVLVCGRHALSSVNPTLGTKFSRLLGEIVSFTVPSGRGDVRYCGYVTESPEAVFTASRDDEFDLSEWEPAPAASRSINPFKGWCWDLLVASWISEIIHSRRNGQAPAGRSTWGWLLDRLNAYYDNISSVQQIVHRVAREIDIVEGRRDPESLRFAEEVDEEEEEETEEDE